MYHHIHRPLHYMGRSNLEAIDIIDELNLDPYMANILKYLARWDRKGDPMDNIRKAHWYAARRAAQASESITFRIRDFFAAFWRPAYTRAIVLVHDFGLHPILADAFVSAYRRDYNGCVKLLLDFAGVYEEDLASAS